MVLKIRIESLYLKVKWCLQGVVHDLTLLF